MNRSQALVLAAGLVMAAVAPVVAVGLALTRMRASAIHTEGTG